jgi:RHS repeat-associated protein
LLKESFGNGVATEFDYYPLSHRLQNKKTYKGSTTYSERTYKYDLYSNLTDIGDPLGSKGSGALSSVSYDSLSRLTSYTPSGSTSAVSFSYDAQGNMLSNSKSYGTDTYEYTSLKPHAVTKIGDKSFDYDDNGNMTSDPYRVMTYNAQNQLTKVTMTNKTVIAYDYDYTAARTNKTVTRTDPNLANHVSTTYYLGDAMEIRDNNVILHLYAKNTMVVTKGLGTLDELLASAGTKDLHFEPTFRFSLAMPFLLLLFSILFIASFRPVAAPILTPRLCPARGLLRHKAGLGEVDLSNQLLSLWSSYTNSMHEALQALPYCLAPKLLTLFLALLFTVEMPMHEAFAGDSGTVANISDATYTYYHHGDHLGSSHVITEGNSTGGKHSGLKYNQGDLIQRYEYAPYGQETYVLNPNLEFDPSYTGQTYDADSGLYYYNARYYNPELGRFIQADTVVPDATNLQAHNRYTYTVNNPLRYVDPSGHGFWSWFKKIAGAFFGALIGAFITVMTLGAMLPIGAALASASLSQVMLAGAVGGLVGGAIGGGISGGVRGALVGALLGAIGGALFAGVDFGLGRAGLSDLASTAVIGVVGASISYATGGWKGLLLFGVGFLGAYTGSKIGMTVNEIISYNRFYRQNVSSKYTLAGGDNTSETQALSTIRLTGPNETYYRYESGISQYSKVTTDGGLKAETFAAPANDGVLPTGQLNSQYNLPDPQIPRGVYFKVTPPEGTMIIGPGPVAGGAGNEVMFPAGAPPGSVSGPYEVPLVDVNPIGGQIGCAGAECAKATLP